MYHQTHRMDIMYPLLIWVQRNFNDLAEMSTAPQGHSAGNTAYAWAGKGKDQAPHLLCVTRPPQVPTGHFANSAGCQGTALTVLRGASGCPLRKGAQSWAVTDALFPNFGKAQSCGSPGAPCAGSRLAGSSRVATQMGTRIPLGGGGRGHHHALLRLPPCGVLLRNRVPPAWRQAQAPDADAGACRKMHSPRQCRPRGSSRGGAAFVLGWGVGLGTCPLTRSPRTAPPGGPAPPSCFSGRSHPARHPYFTRDKCHRARGPARRTGFWVRPRLCFDAVSTAGAQRG